MVEKQVVFADQVAFSLSSPHSGDSYSLMSLHTMVQVSSYSFLSSTYGCFGSRHSLRKRFGNTRCEPCKMYGWSLEWSAYSFRLLWVQNQTNPMKQKRKIMAHFPAHFLIHFVNISKNHLLHKDSLPCYEYCLYQENGKKITYTKWKLQSLGF